MFKGAAVNRLVGLDGLRGMAALMVFLFHLAVIFELDIPELPFYLGVDLFFALSGFVMARSYEARLRTELPALRFIIIRYRRLWLPLAVGSVIGCALVYFTEGLDFAALLAFVAILFFMPAPWMPQGSFIFNLPAWSLFVEIVCNALHAAFFVWASNLLLAIMLAVSAVVLITSTVMHGSMIWGNHIESTLAAIPRGTTSYLIGILIFRIWGEKPFGNSPLIAILGLPLFFSMGFMLPAYLEAILVVFIVSPLALRASLALGEAKWASNLGMLSYPLYAVHFPILASAKAVGMSELAGGLVTLACAIYVTVVYERRRRGIPLPSFGLGAWMRARRENS